MRLTQIKLAGFKSFVDPTSIQIPGDLVGVVGPNGCGKSNIIDAVRWVLGESKASALRGESMQDVIFNGSSLRKPVARASVEMVFDNSMGKFAGQWSQYTEISVKRILQRDGESAYLINNQQVRRRDVQDIFLGTGVGPRAYAIIEQGMISRVIEAKPEDLRVFLEEAAGVSKYKERRRETEHRLADTRENLDRVADISGELETQIGKLEKQAEVARQYRSLQTDVQQRQNQLWLLRKREAEAERERQTREIERATNAIEAETARLREIELRLEQTRVAQYESGDAVNAEQGELFKVNTEISRLESEIRYVADTRQRLENQLAQLVAQIGNWEQQSGELSEALVMWNERRETAAAHSAEAHALSEEENGKLPEVEQAFRSIQSQLADARSAIARAEQAYQVEQTHLAHASRALAQLDAREERLKAESAGLVEPDPMELDRLESELESLASELTERSSVLAQMQEELPALETQRESAQEEAREIERERSALAGRRATLKQIQDRVDENGKVHGWLEKHALAALPRLWQQMTVEAGWETAIESVLRERLHALHLADAEALQKLLADPPPAKVSVFALGARAEVPKLSGFRPLVELVREADAAVRAILEDWLAGYHAVDGEPSAAALQSLPVGAVLVNRAGHQFHRYSISFYAPDTGDAGILARQREIESLGRELELMDEHIEAARAAVTAIETRISDQRQEITRAREAEGEAKQRRHDAEIAHLRMAESQNRIRERLEQIERELGEIHAQKETEQADRLAAEEKLAQHQDEIEQLRAEFNRVKSEHDAAEAALETQRHAVQAAEREVQEAGFAERECAGKIEEIERAAANLRTQRERAIESREQLEAERASLEDTAAREDLQTFLAQRLEREQSLAAARIHHDELTATLRTADEERLTCERNLGPLRDRVGDLRLKEQAARLNYEQYATQLAEVHADEEALAATIEKGIRPGGLQNEIARLNQAIADLGAVNLAALDELVASRERKDFLDAQAADLNEALTTLENAIRRIDRETRELLQQTFDQANAHFSQMFPTLFGGGEAKLVMSGEEILDAGIQVIAHPPGKKNASIHLLSGGEKALTAIALVFSLFQLNPAPFCLLDEVDAPLDDSNTERFCNLVKKMSQHTQFLFISHNKIAMEMAQQLIGVTMQESGVSRVVEVDMERALQMRDEAIAA